MEDTLVVNQPFYICQVEIQVRKKKNRPAQMLQTFHVDVTDLVNTCSGFFSFRRIIFLSFLVPPLTQSPGGKPGEVPSAMRLSAHFPLVTLDLWMFCPIRGFTPGLRSIVLCEGSWLEPPTGNPTK